MSHHQTPRKTRSRTPPSPLTGDLFAQPAAQAVASPVLSASAATSPPRPTPAATATGAASAPVIPVSRLNRLVRERLEAAFPLCWVAGEISNLSYAASGHVYFSLKDAEAQVRCAMFRNRAQLLGWRLADGQRVEARALVTLYEARGDFQLNVESLRKAGLGDLYERFLQLKDRLTREGLFALEHKRPLPAFPGAIGIITSPQAAALRDVLTTLARRAPHVRLILYPTPVQGESAAAQIIDALNQANRRAECDVLILCRGGGSLEDLWAFNDEALARALRNSALPVIAGIGHETDVTLADFAADQRAPTPTAAAELAAPERAALHRRLDAGHAALSRQIRHILELRGQQLDLLAGRLIHPARRLATQSEQLHTLRQRLNGALRLQSSRRQQTLAELAHRLRLGRPRTAERLRQLDTLREWLSARWRRYLNTRQEQLSRLSDGLSHLNPHAVLARGYGIVTDAHGRIVRDSQTLAGNERIRIRLYKGALNARVETTEQENQK